MEGITKRFPGVVANFRIDYEINKGKIHALLGENGAGKSTLMNVLCGVYEPEEGEISIGGKKVSIKTPRDAISLGIGIVPQHFALVPTFTTTENIMLGLKSSREPFLDRDLVATKMAGFCKKHGLHINLDAKIWQMSVGEQERVEIIKAIYRGADILVMDEPTSVLTPPEVDGLFKFLRSFAEEGHSVVFITHKLDEVMAIADVVTVLREGRVVGTKLASDTNERELARMMVGKYVRFSFEKSKRETGEVVLEVRNLRTLNDRGIRALKDVSFSVHAREILAVAGVAGNGQKELEEVITGTRKAAGGQILVEGRDLTSKPPWVIIEQGVGYIPEDRMGMGLIMELSVAENMILGTDLLSKYIDRKAFLNYRKAKQDASRMVSEFNVKTTSIDSVTSTLSGGNLQKLLLAREFSRDPRLLIACDPTRGLDVGASEFVRRMLLDRKEKGAAVLLISTDLDEVFSVSDRIAVFFEGRVMDIVPTEKARIDDVGLLMSGVKELPSS